MEAHLARIARVNPKINAIVTLVADRAMDDARKADEHQARGGALGPLHGLPVAHKDLINTAGIRTTFGSPLFRDNVPTIDAPLVKRVRDAGAITLGKTNTPEFGAGSNTFNPVFGATVNPYDLRKTVGGSSGGAAAALRCGMVPIASGSDIGRLAAQSGGVQQRRRAASVAGPRAGRRRLVVAARDDGTDGAHRGRRRALPQRDDGNYAPDPLALDDDPAIFRAPLERSFKGARVAWFTSMGGIPFEPEIRRVVDANRKVFAELGCVISDAEPDFTGVDEAFPTLRHLGYHANYAAKAREHPDAGQGHDQVGDRAGGAEAAAPTSRARWRGRRACTCRWLVSSRGTTTSSRRSRRSSRST